jgi:hypothetical protein
MVRSPSTAPAATRLIVIFAFALLRAGTAACAQATHANTDTDRPAAVEAVNPTAAPTFTLGGFGTLGAVYHDAPGLEFRRWVGQGRGARAGEIDFGTDSLLGLQLTTALSPTFDLQLQGIIQRGAQDDWQPTLERAFVRWSPDDSVMVRLGRIDLGYYLLADALEVGYSYLTLRPPVEVYGILPSLTLDGGDVRLKYRIGDGIASVRLLGGRMPGQIALPDGTAMDIASGVEVGGSLDYLCGDWQTSLAFARYHSRDLGQFERLASALRQTPFPQAQILGGDFVAGTHNSYATELGVAYDHSPFQAHIVYVRLSSTDLTGPDLNAGFVLAAYRIGRLTPYSTFAISDSFANIRSTGLPDIPVFAALNAAVYEAQTTSQAMQRSLAVGVRYDLATHFDLKAQVDRVWLHQSNLIFDRNVPPPDHTAMTVFGVALDFAF